jgi:hypothetical protein
MSVQGLRTRFGWPSSAALKAKLQVPHPVRKVAKKSAVSVLPNIPSFKMDETIFCESLHEKAFCTILETDPNVVAYAAQPRRFFFLGEDGKDHSYCNDFVYLTRKDELRYVEVTTATYAQKRDKAFRMGVAFEQCAAFGATFELWTEDTSKAKPKFIPFDLPDDSDATPPYETREMTSVRLKNAWDVLDARRADIEEGQWRSITHRLASGAKSALQLSESLGQNVNAVLKDLKILIAWSQVDTDLFQPIGESSLFHLPDSS